MICPYCKKVLDKAPRRKSKCLHCNKYIYVRSGVLVTKKQAIFIDSKKRLENLQLEEIMSSKSLDELWAALNKGILYFSQRKDFYSVSSIYLEMALITYAEEKYENCILFYLLCSHYGAYQELLDCNLELDLESLMQTENYMTASLVRNSLKELKLDWVDINKLGRLAVAQEFPIEKKIEILQDIFEGNREALNTLEFSNNQILKKNTSRSQNIQDSKPVQKRKKKSFWKQIGKSLSPQKRDGGIILFLKVCLIIFILSLFISILPTLLGIGIAKFLQEKVDFKNEDNKKAVKIFIIALAIIINLFLLL